MLRFTATAARACRMFFLNGLFCSMSLSIGWANAARAQDSFFDGYFEVANIDGSNGFVMDALANDDELGRSVSGAGDINGDGIADLVIGAPATDVNGNDSVGAAYVVFGSTGGFTASLDLSSLNGSNGFVVQGGVGDAALGLAVSGAGDLNDDGIDDLIVGAGGLERGYVVFGSQDPFPATLVTSVLNGSNGFTINGVGFSFSVDRAGDINSDGIDDLIIGGSDGTIGQALGKSYVVFGSATAFPSELDLGSLDGDNGFVINGRTSVINPQTSVGGAGDVNDDGIADILVGDAFQSAPGGSREGESFVVFGSAGGFPAAFDLGTLDGNNGFRMLGEEEDYSGWSVSGAGDVNGDGIADMIVGAPQLQLDFGDGFVGKSYVVFGTAGGFPAELELSSLDGQNGFAVIGDCGIFYPGDCGSKDLAGYSVSAAGDVDGDGIDDIIIGAPRYAFSAEAYVIFGSIDGFPAEILVGSTDGTSGLLNGNNGFAIEESSVSNEHSVSGAGDVNGDGIADIIVGRTGAGSGGQAYVIFGARVPEPGGVALVSICVSLGLLRRRRRRSRLEFARAPSERAVVNDPLDTRVRIAVAS